MECLSYRLVPRHSNGAWRRIAACLVAVGMLVCLARAVCAQSTIEFAWDWTPEDSGFTSGPNGDVVFDIYMRSEDESDYAYDYPLIGGEDECWWDADRYRCRTSFAYTFDPGVYYFVAVAYLVDSPDFRSLSSNEAMFVIDSDGRGSAADQSNASSTSGGGSGGGCFIGTIGGR